MAKKLSNNKKIKKMEKFRKRISILSHFENKLYEKCCKLIKAKEDPGSWIFDYLHNMSTLTAQESFDRMKEEIVKELSRKKTIDAANAAATKNK